uniref:ATP synthase protein 8 n=1 Tax=Trichophyton rubrum TaxID=5551 RepID=ATP8_TRIRU|nr:RecName: Full=ATP synthase protein 8; AltName: Full=A6L; AltName: Full=F-ATPase subunit 8 [Trichophyton rubrum]CAA61358.1 ATP8 [Trichophyton rubrum]
MPQLIPFFFFNQVVFTLISLSFIFFVFSKYILPWIVRLYVSRNQYNSL